MIDVADFPFAVTITGTLLSSNVAQVDRARATTADTIRTATGLTLFIALLVMSLAIILTRSLLKWNPEKQECIYFTPLARIPPQIYCSFLPAMGNNTPSVGDPRGPRLIKFPSRNVPNAVSPVFLGAQGFGSADLTVEAGPSARYARNDR